MRQSRFDEDAMARAHDTRIKGRECQDSQLHLGLANAMGANANERHGPPIKANDEAKTGCLREEDNAEWRARVLVPFQSVNRP